MPAFKQRKTSKLTEFRISDSGYIYFITLCTKKRERGLSEPEVAEVILTQLKSQSKDGDFSLLVGVIMPDHIHLLIELGLRLSLSAIIGKFKSKTKLKLPNQLGWQRNYFDHRLREKDRLEAFGFYVFMNPYRAGLVNCSERWEYFICDKPEFFSFLNKRTEDGCPMNAWLDFNEGISAEVSRLMD